MTPIKKIIIGYILLTVFYLKPFQVNAQTPEESAFNSVKNWLFLIDQEKYGESYDQTTEIFQSPISKNEWEKICRGKKKKLGKILSRTLNTKKRTSTLAGHPDGDYFVFEFETIFEYKKTGTETVITKLDKDNIWRISGYFIE